MKVFLDWDSGPYECVSLKRCCGHEVEAEMSEEDYRAYEAVLELYTQWQDRLERMRKGKE